jgi:hypothetical protein
VHIFPFHQCFEIRWIVLAVRFNPGYAPISLRLCSGRSASRIMRSFSRVIVTRASGTAIVERTTRMAVAMMSSRSVKPRSEFALYPLW